MPEHPPTTIDTALMIVSQNNHQKKKEGQMRKWATRKWLATSLLVTLIGYNDCFIWRVLASRHADASQRPALVLKGARKEMGT